MLLNEFKVLLQEEWGSLHSLLWGCFVVSFGGCDEYENTGGTYL